MKFRIRFADQVVGVFVLIAIAALAVILILMGLNQRWFAKNYYFSSRFLSASGLNVGMPITLKGFEIGKLDSLSLNERNEVDVRFHIYDTYYQKVKPNSILELASNPLGLGGGLRFHPGNNDSSPLAENSFVPSLALPEGQELVQKQLVAMPKNGDAINDILSKVGPVLDNLNGVMISIQGTIATIDTNISGDDGQRLGNILVDVNTAVKNLNRLISDVKERISTAFKSINTITGNLEHTTGALKDPKGMVTTLLDPKGSVAALLDDDNSLYNQIQEILSGLNATVEQIKTFSQYINNTSPQISGILEKGRQTLDQGKDVLEGLRNNPLLRGGITAQKEQPSTFQSYRDEDF